MTTTKSLQNIKYSILSEEERFLYKIFDNSEKETINTIV